MKNYELHEIELISDLKEMIINSSNKFGERKVLCAIHNGSYSEKSYIQLSEDINALGTALIELNLRGRHIAVIGDNSYEWIVTYLAVVNGIGVIVPIDKELPADEIKYIAEHGDVCAIVYSGICKERILQIQEQLPGVKYFISIGSDKPAFGHIDFNILADSGRKALENGNRTYLDTKIDPDKLCSILYTSGTTGVSKGVMLSHRNITSVIVAEKNHVKLCGSVLSVLPVHHAYEAICGIFTMIYNGSVIYINDSLKNFKRNMMHIKPDNLVLVPAFVEAMYKGIWDNVKNSDREKLLKAFIIISNMLLKMRIDIRRILFKSIHEAFGGNLKMIVCGGAPLSADYISEFRELGILILNGYGITECSPLVACNCNRYYNDSSVGIAISCCKIKIDSPDTDGNGEILVKGKNVMLGYYKNHEATKEAFTYDGWFRTGDYGHLDENEFLYITGRKKNLIVLNNGKNVYPEEIESYLLKCSLIKEVIVYCKEEDEGRESVLTAEVFPDVDYADENGINNIEYVINEQVKIISERLPYYKRVSKIKIRETEFEKTSTKKIKRFTMNNKSDIISTSKTNQSSDNIKPENETQALIEQIMCSVLNMKRISIRDNLFEFGLDSLGVIEAVAMLSGKGIEISTMDFYKGRTIENISFIISGSDDQEVSSDITQEIHECCIYQSSISKSNLKNVLLTGATGYLGAHILAELMNSTTVTVYCLVRDKQRFYKTLDFYFDNELTSLFENRIKVITGDITITNLGLTDEDYSGLAKLIDTTIHSAADVRHIADINESEKVNVFGTENIINFAKEANSIYHHISTMAISGENVPGKTGEVVFDETKVFIGQDYNKNVYVQGKFKAEELVLQHIKNGLDGRIYRVGNLTWREDGKFQKNSKENGFIMRLAAFKNIGAYPAGFSDYKLDFTPVNQCAMAVVMLLSNEDDNRIYHLYNCNTISLADALYMIEKRIKSINDEDFLNLIFTHKSDKDVSVLMFYLSEFSKLKNNGAIVKVNNDITVKKLLSLGFQWPRITNEYVDLFNNVVSKV